MLNVPSLCKNSNFNQKLVIFLDKCRSMAELKPIHALLITFGIAQDHAVVGKILTFSALSDSGKIDYAYRILSSLSNPTVFDWNTVIRGYSKSRNPNRSISVFVEMLQAGISPDHMTYPFVIKASSRLMKRELGVVIHARVVQTGFCYDMFIQNSLVHMYGSCGDIVFAHNVFDEMSLKNSVSWNSMLDAYAKCGDVTSARRVFDLMPGRDVVSWSSLIDGYVKSGEYTEAMVIFERMRNSGPKANEVTMISVLCACAHLGALDQGKIMHHYIIDNKLPQTLALCTSLVDMYAKCGAIEEARSVFRGVSVHNTDVLIWNAMIGGLATHGFVKDSFELFHQMEEIGVHPDEITYLCLLSACSHGGLVKKAWYFFECLGKKGMKPKSEHYACMVDVLARAGQVNEAYKFITRSRIEPTASMLGALLCGCINHGKLDLAEVIGRKLIELEPDHDGRYIGLSNVYAINQRFGDARTTREAMEKKGVRKMPGFSVIEISGMVCRFIAHDKIHPESEHIYRLLHFVVTQMKIDIEEDILEFCLSRMENV